MVTCLKRGKGGTGKGARIPNAFIHIEGGRGQDTKCVYITILIAEEIFKMRYRKICMLGLNIKKTGGLILACRENIQGGRRENILHTSLEQCLNHVKSN